MTELNRELPAHIAADQQPDFFRQFRFFQPAGVFVGLVKGETELREMMRLRNRISLWPRSAKHRIASKTGFRVADMGAREVMNLNTVARRAGCSQKASIFLLIWKKRAGTEAKERKYR